jgi:hypothetical protein
MRARLDKRWIIGAASAVVIMMATLLAVTSANAGAASCDASRFIGPDGKFDTASYLQCQVPSVSPNEVGPGGTIQFTGGGFASGSPITIELHSTPVTLATTTADDVGNFSVAVSIPSDTEPGSHELWAVGVDPDGNALTVVLPITVVAATSANSGTLPVTGLDVGRYAGIGLALIALGGAAVWGARRERSSVEA